MAPRPPLKGVVDFSDHFSRVPVPVIVACLLTAAGVVAWAWQSVWVGLGFGSLALGDAVMLVALPRLGRSYGAPHLPLLSLTALRLALALVGTVGPSAWSLPLLGLIQIGLSLMAIYACWIEPTRLGVTRITLRSPRLNGCPPLRLLHISDLHIERITARERRLLRLVEELAADVIVITGDYLNLSYIHDATAQRETRELLSQLRAPDGVYAIRGTLAVDPSEVVARLLDGLNITWLRDQVASLWQKFRQEKAGEDQAYLLDTVTVQSWKDYRRASIAPMEKEQAVMTVMFAFVGITTVFIVFVVFYMIISHKSKDIGILKSIGASNVDIVGLFCGFAFLVGLLGSGVGLFAGWLFLLKINRIEDWLFEHFGFQLWDRTIYAIGDIPSQVEFKVLVIILFSAIGACLAGALVPSWKAARLKPAETLQVSQL